MRDLFSNQPLPTPPPRKAFDGETYEPARDYVRLTGQMAEVHKLMSDGKWRTLGQIADVVRGSEAAISARLRDLRKEKYGALTVERRYLADGLFQYRLRESPKETPAGS
jgi:hypothetical protein